MKLLLVITTLLANCILFTMTLPTRGPLILVQPPGSRKKINLGTFGLGTQIPQYTKSVQDLKTLIAQFFNIKIEVDPKKLPIPFDDMILSEAQVLRLLDAFKKLLQPEGRRSKRKIVDFTVDDSKWDVSKPIKYKIKGFKTGDGETINEAIKHWEDNTCIRFQEVGKETKLKENHIVFNKGFNCASNLGRNNGSEAFNGIELAVSACGPLKGVAIHEIGHAVGLVHEQMRLDRDAFVKIDFDNINFSLINFMKYFIRGLTTLGVPYDVGSIMHYSSFAGAIREKKRTIITKDKFLQLNLGQRTGLSFYDIKIVNLAYCKDKCKSKKNCQRGGITDPNNCNKCICPDGFGGNDCQTVGSVHNGCTPSQQIITVTAQEQCLKSPNYGGSGAYDPFTECNWHLKAPVGETIEMYFKGPFSVFMYSSQACFHWVEVKYRRNLELPGARFCGSSLSKDRLVSFGNLAVISFRSNFQGKRPIPAAKRKGFQLCFKLAGTKTTGSPKTPRTTKAPEVCKNKLKLNCKNFNKTTEWVIVTEPNHGDMEKAILQCDGKLKVDRNIQFNITATPGSMNLPRVLSVCVRRSGAKRTRISLKLPGRGTGRHFKLAGRKYCKVMSIEAESIAIELEKRSKTMSIWDLTVEVCKG